MNSIKIEQENFEQFFQCPFDVYAPDSPYVSPLKSDLKRILDRERNPLFRAGGEFTYYTASAGKKVLGRIVAHIHRASNRLHGLSRGYFGFFDCADEAGVARRLLDEAENWLRRKGCTEIAGNFNLTAMQQIGVTTGGFENPPYTDQTYTPPHIAELLSGCGYRAFFPMNTYEIAIGESVLAALESDKVSALREDPSLVFKKITRRNFRSCMDAARAVLNEGFARNPMFVPLTREEYWFQAGEMMWIMDPDISVLVYRRERPVGVVVCIPDLNPFVKSVRSRFGWLAPLRYLRYRYNARRDGGRAVIIYYSVAPEEHGKGLAPAMLHHVVGKLLRGGYRTLGVTWIAEVNKPSLRQMERLGARPLHRLRLFRKELL